jgi:hypothetical protein
MLFFRGGVWRTVEISLSDPLISQAHRMQLAASVATEMQQGKSVQQAMAKAEANLYGRLFPGLVPREEHGTPKN